jgi:signal transduction histidine kinase
MAATFDDMIDRLQASFERQKRFTSDASHELRTPLAVMQADLSLALRRPRSNTEYRATLESAQEEVSRLSHIVNDLLVLARLDTDVAQIAREPVQLDDLLEMVVAGLRPLATERSIRLSYTINAPASMIGDPTRLKQVFFNLLDNAIAYTPDGGSIRVSMVTDGAQAEVTVADTGIGISPEDLPHVFERFYRSEEARTRNHEGTGLGLAIAQKVVHAHQGRIEVSSMPGQGTTFQVLLPLLGPLTGQGVTGRLSPLAILAAAAH